MSPIIKMIHVDRSLEFSRMQEKQFAAALAVTGA